MKARKLIVHYEVVILLIVAGGRVAEIAMPKNGQTIFLLSHSGKIIAKNSHGADLKAAVGDLFQFKLERELYSQRLCWNNCGQTSRISFGAVLPERRPAELTEEIETS